MWGVAIILILILIILVRREKMRSTRYWWAAQQNDETCCDDLARTKAALSPLNLPGGLVIPPTGPAVGPERPYSPISLQFVTPGSLPGRC